MTASIAITGIMFFVWFTLLVWIPGLVGAVIQMIFQKRGWFNWPKWFRAIDSAHSFAFWFAIVALLVNLLIN